MECYGRASWTGDNTPSNKHLRFPFPSFRLNTPTFKILTDTSVQREEWEGRKKGRKPEKGKKKKKKMRQEIAVWAEVSISWGGSGLDGGGEV